MRVKRALLGDHPRALVLLLAPTILALLVDLVLRGGVLAGYALQGKAIYASSLLVSAAFWALPLWIAARFRRARPFVVVFWILPFVTFCFGGQVLYHRVFHAYVGRDTVRLGIALRGTLGDWFGAWGSRAALVAMLVAGFVITGALVFVVRRAATRITGRVPVLLAITFVAALVCCWVDMVDSRFLQAATPDACFVHGAVHALRVGITGKGRARRGISLRTPARLPELSLPRRRPNVLLVLTESVRADAMCSDPPPKCHARFLDEVAPDRIPLGKLTTPSPGTFSACMVLWTGLPVTADFATAHAAPVLWELARAVGYRTAYVTSQNLQFENFGAFVEHAGIDVLVSATELGGLKQEQLGAPDERAAAEMLRFVNTTPPDEPYFAVLHLSNTHAPYRDDPALQPYTPSSLDPIGKVDAFHNHYRNSVALQERTVSDFLRDVRAGDRWEDTVVLFVSDHGEQFREHGGLYHIHSLFDEEVRVPGWLVGGAHVIDDERRAALASFDGFRTYLQDVNATIVDLFGLGDVRSTLPFATPQSRSLVQRSGRVAEPMMALATSTAVWEADDVRSGIMRGNLLLVGAPGASFACYDIDHDPMEQDPLPANRCGRVMIATANAFFK